MSILVLTNIYFHAWGYWQVFNSHGGSNEGIRQGSTEYIALWCTGNLPRVYPASRPMPAGIGSVTLHTIGSYWYWMKGISTEFKNVFRTITIDVSHQVSGPGVMHWRCYLMKHASSHEWILFDFVWQTMLSLWQSALPLTCGQYFSVMVCAPLFLPVTLATPFTCGCWTILLVLEPLLHFFLCQVTMYLGFVCVKCCLVACFSVLFSFIAVFVVPFGFFLLDSPAVFFCYL